MDVIFEKAYAKLNLSLSVGSKRADGFHELESVMTEAGIYDGVTVSFPPGSVSGSSEAGGVRLICTGLPFPDGESKNNLAFRAAEIYCAAAGISPEAEIVIEKKIPLCGGLGGGSADAAAVLRAFEKHFGALGEEKLLSAAASLGSDVPFCVIGGTALCTGRGEKMTVLSAPSFREFRTVIVRGGEKLSTADSYRRLDESAGNRAARDSKRLIDALCSDTDTLCRVGKETFNDFELIYPTCAAIKEKLLGFGAFAAGLCGSGPNVFGMFEDEQAAQDAEEFFSK